MLKYVFDEIHILQNVYFQKNGKIGQKIIYE